MAYSILLVDDEEHFREEFRDSLCEYNVVEASSGKEALELLSRPNEIDLVILDVVMPGPPGTEILKRIKALCPDLGVIILTGYGTKETVVAALKGRADDYLEKPVDVDRAREVIQRLLHSRVPLDGVAPGGIDEKIQRVMHFVGRNYDKKVTLKDAAALVALSPKYFSRVFELRAGLGFSEYKVKVRTEKAAELLASTDYSVDEISYMVGYENPESLARVFKRVWGSTPADYRRRTRARGGPRKVRQSGGSRGTGR